MSEGISPQIVDLLRSRLARIEDELDATRRDLEAAIRDREIADDLANAARLQAQTASLGRLRFLAAASHDLRQPLQTLSLLQGLLARRVHDDGAQQLLARSDEALMAMSGMLNTLLDINQLEAGVIRPEVVDFPINDILEILRTEFAYHTKAKGLDWRALACRLSVRTDPRLLDQMVRNLLSNAVKYTNNGRIILGCRRRGGSLRIEVHDTGLGIPASQLRAIFEAFHQIDTPAREASHGLGLGLAIVQRVADLLDLTVDVRSQEGRGSMFSIEVPLTPSGARIMARDATPPAPELGQQAGSILIVEDDPALRESLELFLIAEGYLTTAACDGEEAAHLVEQMGLQPDLVIVDFNLPSEMTGLQVMTRLRAALPFDPPALVLTGDISTATLREITSQGYELRNKPVTTADLRQLVRRMLAKSRRQAPDKPPAAAPGREGSSA